MDTAALLALATAAFVVAGAVKGLAGMGLPTTAIAAMTLAVDPRTAIALTLFPMLFTNLWQAIRSGDILRALRTYAPFAIVLGCGVLITSLLTADVSDRTLFGVLGGVIIVFVAVNLRFTPPPLPDRWDRAAQIGAGAVGGVIGGLCGVWAPPMAVYLLARQTPKEEFVRASGLLIFLGSVPLCIAYLRQGVMTAELSLISLSMIIPALIGFSVGEMLRRRLSPERFRLIFLYVFLVLGLNLLRRAIWG
ncbi:MAG: sulfite exporter TauE/SafE family protein [Rhodobacteraceae bacterium]|nr:sulfite exporter TauE/SafE family protein [Paracoccaceae bacterium]